MRILKCSLEDSESLQRSVTGDDLHVNTVGNDLSILHKLGVFSLGELSETKLDAGGNFLAARVLEHGSSEGFLSMRHVSSTASDRHKDCSDCDTG